MSIESPSYRFVPGDGSRYDLIDELSLQKSSNGEFQLVKIQLQNHEPMEDVYTYRGEYNSSNGTANLLLRIHNLSSLLNKQEIEQYKTGKIDSSLKNKFKIIKRLLKDYRSTLHDRLLHIIKLNVKVPNKMHDYSCHFLLSTDNSKNLVLKYTSSKVEHQNEPEIEYIDPSHQTVKYVKYNDLKLKVTIDNPKGLSIQKSQIKDLIINALKDRNFTRDIENFESSKLGIIPSKQKTKKIKPGLTINVETDQPIRESRYYFTGEQDDKTRLEASKKESDILSKSPLIPTVYNLINDKLESIGKFFEDLTFEDFHEYLITLPSSLSIKIKDTNIFTYAQKKELNDLYLTVISSEYSLKPLLESENFAFMLYTLCLTHMEKENQAEQKESKQNAESTYTTTTSSLSLTQQETKLKADQSPKPIPKEGEKIILDLLTTFLYDMSLSDPVYYEKGRRGLHNHIFSKYSKNSRFEQLISMAMKEEGGPSLIKYLQEQFPHLSNHENLHLKIFHDNSIFIPYYKKAVALTIISEAFVNLIQELGLENTGKEAFLKEIKTYLNSNETLQKDLKRLFDKPIIGKILKEYILTLKPNITEKEMLTYFFVNEDLFNYCYDHAIMIIKNSAAKSSALQQETKISIDQMEEIKDFAAEAIANLIYANINISKDELNPIVLNSLKERFGNSVVTSIYTDEFFEQSFKNGLEKLSSTSNTQAVAQNQIEKEPFEELLGYYIFDAILAIYGDQIPKSKEEFLKKIIKSPMHEQLFLGLEEKERRYLIEKLKKEYSIVGGVADINLFFYVFKNEQLFDKAYNAALERLK